jgi:6-phosphogluconate dehydrogenase
MKVGMVGLGRMGGNMAERLRRHDHEVVGFDPMNDATDVASLADLVTALGDAGTRVAWVMVPSGDPTESTVSELVELLEAGDVIVEGGNSNWNDSVRRNGLAAARGIGFVDCGTSGGIWGLDEGYCLMVGGEPEVVKRVQPVFDALAP